MRAFLILILLILPFPAFAWGPEGHAIVADIAAREISPAARHQVEVLLGGPAEASMAAVSSWADRQGRARPQTRPWHYVDIEIGSAGYVAARDCPEGDCVVGAIARQEAILADAAQSRDARAEALMWLIHLVGDLHQPLHCADDHDRGGNEKWFWIDGRFTNLHRLWDDAPAGLDAAALDRAITPAERQAWRRGDPAAWADQSFRIAQAIYRDPEKEPGRDIVRKQLERAGIRLAAILDADLR